MEFYRNRNGELEFYGHKQNHPIDFSFFEQQNIAVLVQSPAEFHSLAETYSESELAELKLLSTDQMLIQINPLISSLVMQPPLAFDIIVILDELSKSNEETLRRISMENSRFFSIAEVFRKSSPSSVTQTISFRSAEFSIFPTVEVPSYFTNWAYINFLHSTIEKFSYTDILEMFSGSGAIGLSLANEIENLKVECLDANIHAIRSMRISLANHSNLDVSVTQSELFGAKRNSEKKYDLILGNPPHMNLPIDYPEQINGRDPNFEIHKNFYIQAGDFLKPNGRIVLIENAGSNIVDEFYPTLPASLRLEDVYELPDGFWKIVSISKS